MTAAPRSGPEAHPAAPWLYRVARLVVRLGMAGYFSGIEIEDRHHIPDRGPVVFASNHPHSITDALVLGHGAGRMLHFLAHSGLFSNRFKAWFLRRSGVIPIYRAHDVSNAADANRAMFAACHEVLAAGGAIGIFPEGTSAEERRVQKLKTGAARIALGAEAAAGWGLGVRIVPVGLNFESSNRFRSRVLIRFGAPLVARDFRRQYAVDPVAAGAALTEALQTALGRQVVNVAHTESEQLVRDVEDIYRGELLARLGRSIPGRTRFQRSQTVSREFARALDYFESQNPEFLWGLSRRLRRYNAMCGAMKLKDDMLRAAEGPRVRRELGRFVGLGLFGLVPAVLGLVGNYLPYRLTGRLTRQLAPDRTKIHLTQFALGLLLFVPWYLVVFRLLQGKLGAVGAGALIVALGPFGLLARHYFRYLGQRRRMIRFAWLELVHGLRISELRRRRHNLIRELDAAMAEYMTRKDDT